MATHRYTDRKVPTLVCLEGAVSTETVASHGKQPKPVTVATSVLMGQTGTFSENERSAIQDHGGTVGVNRANARLYPLASVCTSGSHGPEQALAPFPAPDL